MEANLEETEFRLEHQEVPKEEAVIKTIRALKDLYGPTSSHRVSPTAEQTDLGQLWVLE
jgi:hypothetical protein